MGILRLIFAVAMCFFTFEKGYSYFVLRSTASADESETQKTELKKARNEFLEILIITVIYLSSKIAKLG